MSSDNDQTIHNNDSGDGGEAEEHTNVLTNPCPVRKKRKIGGIATTFSTLDPINSSGSCSSGGATTDTDILISGDPTGLESSPPSTLIGRMSRQIAERRSKFINMFDEIWGLFDAEAKQVISDAENEAVNIIESARKRAETEAASILQTVTEERDKWEEQKQLMEIMHKSQESTVELNVGGVAFTTSLHTLTGNTAEGSMLAAMFSGRFNNRKDAQGRIFIDRDGSRFSVILNYLRDGSVDLPPHDPVTLMQLWREAAFFQIPELIDIIEQALEREGIFVSGNRGSNRKGAASENANCGEDSCHDSFVHGYHRVTNLPGHVGSVRCVQCGDSIMVSGSHDGMVKIWDLETEQLVRQLDGHSSWVVCLQFLGNQLVTGSADKTIKVWNLDTGRCIRTLLGHSKSVLCLQFEGNTLVSGSNDSTARIWDLAAGTSVQTLVGHETGVWCLQFRGTTLVTGAIDGAVKVWNMSTGACLRTIAAHAMRVCGVYFENNILITGSLDKTAKLWNLTNGSFMRSLIGHTAGLCCLQMVGSKTLVTGSLDKSARVWNIETGECERILTDERQQAVHSLHVHKNMIVIGSHDNFIHIWRFLPK